MFSFELGSIAAGQGDLEMMMVIMVTIIIIILLLQDNEGR